MKNFLKITSSLLMIFTISCSRHGSKNPPPSSDPDPGTQADDRSTSKIPFHIEKFNDIVRQVRQFADKTPHDSQSYFAGIAYNTFLRQVHGPHANMYPLGDPPKPQKFYGVGIKITNGYLNFDGIITNPIKGSPGEKAGIQKGDVIISVDDVSVGDFLGPLSDVEDISKEEKRGLIMIKAVNRIRGEKGTPVKLGMLDICTDQEKEITVIRGPILTAPNFLEDSYFVNLNQEEIFKNCDETLDTRSQTEPKDPLSPHSFEALYVPLRSFGMDASMSLCEQFKELQKKDLDNPLSIGMIIDLRGNSGGVLSEVACMLNTIIPGTEAIVKSLPVEKGIAIEDPSKIYGLYFSEGGHIESSSVYTSYNRNIVVLVSPASASASEIFAGVVQETGRGWVVGQRTFGKGTIQTVEPLQINKGNRVLHTKITTGIYTFNSGRSPQGYGVVPDFSVSITGEPIEVKSDFISLTDRLFFDALQFENTPWEQNRPDERAFLEECVNKDGKLNKAYREDRDNRNERHKHPFMSDYQIELAKDILTCSSLKDDVLEWSFPGRTPQYTGQMQMMRRRMPSLPGIMKK